MITIIVQDFKKGVIIGVNGYRVDIANSNNVAVMAKMVVFIRIRDNEGNLNSGYFKHKFDILWPFGTLYIYQNNSKCEARLYP